MEVFNVAYGGNTTLFELFDALKENLAKYDNNIAKIEPIIGPRRQGDIPHSHASIEKGKTCIGNNPRIDTVIGFKQACRWYYNNI